jgi:hypothetical protein
MRTYAKIIDHKSLIRDMESQAILETDLVVVRQHEKRIKDLQKEQARDAEINNLKNDMNEIKMMLSALLNKST